MTPQQKYINYVANDFLSKMELIKNKSGNVRGFRIPGIYYNDTDSDVETDYHYSSFFSEKVLLKTWENQLNRGIGDWADDRDVKDMVKYLKEKYGVTDKDITQLFKIFSEWAKQMKEKYKQ